MSRKNGGGWGCKANTKHKIIVAAQSAFVVHPSHSTTSTTTTSAPSCAPSDRRCWSHCLLLPRVQYRAGTNLYQSKQTRVHASDNSKERGKEGRHAPSSKTHLQADERQFQADLSHRTQLPHPSCRSTSHHAKLSLQKTDRAHQRVDATVDHSTTFSGEQIDQDYKPGRANVVRR